MDIIEKLQPPGYAKKNRRSIYRIIGRLAGRIRSDAEQILFNFFPIAADMDSVAAHGNAFTIPRFPSDTDDIYRERVATAALYLERQGMYIHVREFLEAFIPGRYIIVEYPKDGFRIGYSKLGYAALGSGAGFFIKVRDLSEAEKQHLYTFLDVSLDPDIEIHIAQWTRPSIKYDMSLLLRMGGASWLRRQCLNICTLQITLDDSGVTVLASKQYHSDIGKRLAELLDTSMEVRFINE